MATHYRDTGGTLEMERPFRRRSDLELEPGHEASGWLGLTETKVGLSRFVLSGLAGGIIGVGVGFLAFSPLVGMQSFLMQLALAPLALAMTAVWSALFATMLFAYLPRKD